MVCKYEEMKLMMNTKIGMGNVTILNISRPFSFLSTILISPSPLPLVGLFLNDTMHNKGPCLSNQRFILAELFLPIVGKNFVVPIHKKNQIVSNFRPRSLLQICSNIVEKLILTNSLFTFFETASKLYMTFY